jgi:hypothetical protein
VIRNLISLVALVNAPKIVRHAHVQDPGNALQKKMDLMMSSLSVEGKWTSYRGVLIISHHRSCIGSAIARELSKTNASVLILEAADDVAQGATKGSSGIVHAGYDDKPGTNRAKFCWAGNQMFPKLDEELHFGFQRNGSLVIARGEEEEKVLDELLERGAINGVKRLRILNKEEVFAMEPYLSEDVTAALYSPDAGNMIPYEYAIALAENAVDNGVELRIRYCILPSYSDSLSSHRRIVKQIEKSADGLFNLTVDHWEPADYLNAMENQQKKNKQTSLIVQFLSAAALGLGAAALITQVLLPESIAMERYGHLLQQFPSDRPYVHFAFPLIAMIIAWITFLVTMPTSSRESSSSKVPPTMETGDSTVGLDEMKLGGSGSAALMKGKVIEQETIRTRYVVNAAGNYSDKIAGMIGDNSFAIQPRIGNYILLHRNQVNIPIITNTSSPLHQTRDLTFPSGSPRCCYSLPLPASQARQRFSFIHSLSFSNFLSHSWR